MEPQKTSLKTLKALVQLAARHNLSELHFGGVYFRRGETPVEKPAPKAAKAAEPEVDDFEAKLQAEINAEIKKFDQSLKDE